LCLIGADSIFESTLTGVISGFWLAQIVGAATVPTVPILL
jgi:hypothetical protein